MALGATTSKHVINEEHKAREKHVYEAILDLIGKNWQALPLKIGFEPWGKYEKQEEESYLAKPRRDIAKFVCWVKVLPQMPKILLARSII